MCNCGNKRSGLTSQSSQSAASHQPVSLPTQKAGPDITFMYTGLSGLSVTGSVTGKRYRFLGPDDKQLVDYRDASSMMSVPVLRRVG